MFVILVLNDGLGTLVLHAVLTKIIHLVIASCLNGMIRDLLNRMTAPDEFTSGHTISGCTVHDSNALEGFLDSRIGYCLLNVMENALGCIIQPFTTWLHEPCHHRAVSSLVFSRRSQ